MQPLYFLFFTKIYYNAPSNLLNILESPDNYYKGLFQTWPMTVYFFNGFSTTHFSTLQEYIHKVNLSSKL